MNYFKGFLIPGLLVLIGFGCAKQQAGPTGPQGPQGGGAPYDYSVVFETGLYPDSSYPGPGNPLSTSGCYPHWLDAANPNTAPPTGEIRIAAGTTVSNTALGLIRFNLSYGIPVNATITACSLQLTTKTSVSLPVGTYSVGVHQIVAPPGNAQWYSGSTWNNVAVGGGWDGSTNPVSISAPPDYGVTPLDSVTLTSTQLNGNQTLVGWNIPVALAQVWLDPAQNGNYGLLLSFEPQSAAAPSTISFWDNTGNNQQKPKMVVEYTVP